MFLHFFYSTPFWICISFTCSGLPTSASCSFSPATVTPGNYQASTPLTVSAPHTSATLGHPLNQRLRGLLGVCLAPFGVLLMAPSGTYRKKWLLFGLLGFGLLLAMPGVRRRRR
jgi:hypothetical protein